MTDLCRCRITVLHLIMDGHVVVGGGCGSDSDTNDDVSGETVADEHLIMEAVSLWTRPRALYLRTGP